MHRRTLAALALAAALTGTTTAFAADANPADPPAVRQLLLDRAAAHGADPVQVVTTAYCESHLDWGAINPVSDAEGVGQWLPPAGANHWSRTPAWREQHIDIFAEYQQARADGDEQRLANAIYFDADMLAWSFGPEAHARYGPNELGWDCYRLPLSARGGLR